MSRFHRCICGARFDTRKELIEHIASLNPKWPKTSLDDEHRQTLEMPSK